MFIKNSNLAVPVYQAPDCDACSLNTGTIICDSLTDTSTEDWVYDENEF